MKAIPSAALIALLLLAGAAPPADAAIGPFTVFITGGTGTVVPGQDVNFTVRTVARGEPAVPDGPPEVTVQSGPGAGRLIPVTAAGPGAWTGNYTVLQADAGNNGYIELGARAYFRDSGGGDSPGYSHLTLWLARPPYAPEPSNLSIRALLLECPDGAIGPGSRLTFQICATYDGAPVPPADISFQITFDPDAGATEKEPVRAGNPSPGRFVVHYTVPARETSGRFELGATCLGREYSWLSTVHLDFFNIVYHELGRNGSRVDYELLVSDRSGNPVNGSDVWVRVSATGWGIGPVGLELGKTDRSGRVRGLADLGPAPGELLMVGWANTSKRSQHFAGTIKLGNATRPATHWGGHFAIERLFPSGRLPSGGVHNLGYRAVYEDAPLRRQELDLYVQMYRGAYPGGSPWGFSGRRLATGEDGGFGLNLTFPEGEAGYAEVTAVGPGPPYPWAYSPAADRVEAGAPPAAPAPEPAPWANATFSRASPGGAVRICASAPAGDLVAANARWDYEYNESTLNRSWLVLNTFTWYLPARKPDGVSLVGRMVLPRHLKSGQNLSVDLSFLNASGGATSASLPLKVRPAAVPEPPADVCCITSIFVVNAMLIVLLVFNYLAGRRGGRRRSLEELDADGQIGAVLGGPGRPARDLSLPIKVELARSEECTACRRKIAQGNLAWRCVCGARYHEHCTGDGAKCPSCDRGWTKR
jgi:hypothetical protein